MMKDKSEKQIQKLILDWLRWNKVFCWKSNNVGIYRKDTNHYIPVGLKGVADILGIINGGVFLAIEVKSGKGKVSPYQREFLQNITDNGGVSFVARCLEDVKLSLKDYLI